MKNLDELYTDISNSINRGNINKLKSLLLNSNQIDITQDSCDFFYFPIERDQPDIASLLIEYFFKIQLPQCEKAGFDHILLLKKLKEHLIDWIEEYGCSEEMQQVLAPYIKLKDNSDGSSRKLDFLEEDTHNTSDESTQPTSGDEHSLLSESNLSQHITESSSDISGLKVYHAIKALQSVYSHANDKLAINIARDFGVHAGDGNATHVRVWHKGVQKIIDIDSSISAEVKGVHLSLNSIIKDVINSTDAIHCDLDGHEQHVNLSGCEYEYIGDDFL